MATLMTAVQLPTPFPSLETYSAPDLSTFFYPKILSSPSTSSFLT